MSIRPAVSVYHAMLLLLLAIPAGGAEVIELSEETWREFAPLGKEVDAIYGDFVLRNDKIIAVIARPGEGRNANMTVRGVGGCLIDLTRRDVWNDEQTAFLLGATEDNRPGDFFEGAPQGNDQLGAFYPGGGGAAFTDAKKVRLQIEDDGKPSVFRSGAAAKRISLLIESAGGPERPQVTLRYTLEDGSPALSVETVFENKQDKSLDVELADALRADRTFVFGEAAAENLFWAYDEHFHTAYGIQGEGVKTRREGSGRGVRVVYEDGGKTSVSLKPGEAYTLRRRVIPAAHLLQARGLARELEGEKCGRMLVSVSDAAGPVYNAHVMLASEGEEAGVARTDKDGRAEFPWRPGDLELSITSPGRGKLLRKLTLKEGVTFNYAGVLSEPGYVNATITGEDGGPIPCKVALYGLEGTESPDFGPDSGAAGVGNCYYSHDGRFVLPLAPGRYEAIISLGPEYDAVFEKIEIVRSRPTDLTAVLKRVVDSQGWVSSDFHSHSSPSGDNTSSQLGRVLNLLCEHIEFAPCTEHNRIDTYIPHLKRLGVEKLMATCSGMELTGSPLPINHQNAFPLERHEHTQDGGAPQTDQNPIVQIERLALWDAGSDKLVQGNHPTLLTIIGDKDNDGQPDGGFEKMFGFMDVMEVHPPAGILTPPKTIEEARSTRNPIFHWMQMLNLGYRIPAVVNTDAHYNHHGSGGLRNWIESKTDDPSEVDTMEMVHAAEHGHLIISTGPFMEVRLKAAADGKEALPGDDALAPEGKAALEVRVQCPNWLDINRVQVFVNGRPVEKLNFTRRETPEKFAKGVVKFDQAIELELEEDAHVIVAAAGEGLELGRVMGPQWGKQVPIAVSNPIFVDVDGDGFEPNGDDLGVPLPADEKELLKRNVKHYHTHDD